MYNDNCNDIYDNNNVSNKNQLYLTFLMLYLMIGVIKEKKAFSHIEVTLNELRTFKEKYHYTKIKAQKNT